MFVYEAIYLSPIKYRFIQIIFSRRGYCFRHKFIRFHIIVQHKKIFIAALIRIFG